MKRSKVNRSETLSVGVKKGVLFGTESKGKVDEKGYEVSSRRMLENLNLALLFSRIQGRMAKEE